MWDVFRCNDIGQDVLKRRGSAGGAGGCGARQATPPVPAPAPLPSPLPPQRPGRRGRLLPLPARPAPAPHPPRARPAPAPLPPRTPPAWAESESPAEAVAARRVKFQRVGSNSGSAAGEIRSPRRLKQLLQVTLQLSV